MATEDAGSERATGGITATGQQATSWSDPAKAMTAPGGEPAGWHGSWPSPETPEAETGNYDGRKLTGGGEPEPGFAWQDDKAPSWGPGH